MCVAMLELHRPSYQPGIALSRHASPHTSNNDDRLAYADRTSHFGAHNRTGAHYVQSLYT